MHFIFDNRARRSFASVDINTIITVFEAPLPKRKAVNLDQMVKFVAFKQPFEQVVLTENLLEIEAARKVEKNERLWVYPISVAKLSEAGSEFESSQQVKLGAGKYVGDKWGGKYLRAPDIFFTILKKGKGKLVKMGEIAEVRFGIKTGANDFFYLTPLGNGSRPGLLRLRNGAGWEGEIEEEFLKPVLTSLQECDKYTITVDELSSLAFVCDKDIEYLENVAMNAFDYIKWGELKSFNHRPSVRSRRNWWSIPKQRKNHFVVMRFRDRRNWTPIIRKDFLVGDTVFVGRLRKSIPVKSGLISLNSTLMIFSSEVFGRINLGEGLLTTYGPDIKPMITIKPEILDFSGFDVESFEYRKVRNIFIECGINPDSNIPISNQEPNPLPDRKELDDVVFDALDLSEGERKDVYRAVCQLVWDRISKAKSVKRRK